MFALKMTTIPPNKPTAKKPTILRSNIGQSRPRSSNSLLAHPGSNSSSKVASSPDLVTIIDTDDGKTVTNNPPPPKPLLLGAPNKSYTRLIAPKPIVQLVNNTTSVAPIAQTVLQPRIIANAKPVVSKVASTAQLLVIEAPKTPAEGGTVKPGQFVYKIPASIFPDLKHTKDGLVLNNAQLKVIQDIIGKANAATAQANAAAAQANAGKTPSIFPAKTVVAKPPAPRPIQPKLNVPLKQTFKLTPVMKSIVVETKANPITQQPPPLPEIVNPQKKRRLSAEFPCPPQLLREGGVSDDEDDLEEYVFDSDVDEDLEVNEQVQPRAPSNGLQFATEMLKTPPKMLEEVTKKLEVHMKPPAVQRPKEIAQVKEDVPVRPEVAQLFEGLAKRNRFIEKNVDEEYELSETCGQQQYSFSCDGYEIDFQPMDDEDIELEDTKTQEEKKRLQLKQKLQLVSPKSGYDCEVCGRKYKTSQSRGIHRRLVHKLGANDVAAAKHALMRLQAK